MVVKLLGAGTQCSLSVGQLVILGGTHLQLTLCATIRDVTCHVDSIRVKLQIGLGWCEGQC